MKPEITLAEHCASDETPIFWRMLELRSSVAAVSDRRKLWIRRSGDAATDFGLSLFCGAISNFCRDATPVHLANAGDFSGQPFVRARTRLRQL